MNFVIDMVAVANVCCFLVQEDLTKMQNIRYKEQRGSPEPLPKKKQEGSLAAWRGA
jgi:hypothetical protein